jgi:PPOX class probable F420-dependent enzyme
MDTVFSERALAVLTGMRIGYIATVRPDGRLSVVPVGVVREDDVLKISTPTSTYKVRNLRLDPRITVCVPDPERPTEYVEIRGVAELADDTDRTFIDGIARQYMNLDEYPHEPRSQARTTITVHPEQVSMPRVQGSGDETEPRP